MTTTRFFAGLAAVAMLGACGHDRHSTSTITVENLSTAEAHELAAPHLSRRSTVRYSGGAKTSAGGHAPITMTIRDDLERASHAASVVQNADRAMSSAVLHFQVVRATASGSIDPALEKVGTALRELLRFQGYELVAQTTMNSAEGRRARQTVSVGNLRLELGARVAELANGAADIQIDLQRPGHGRIMSTNVVAPIGQTVALGSAFPGQAGEALILTVRAERAATRRRTATVDRKVEFVEVLPADVAAGMDVLSPELKSLGRMDVELSAELEMELDRLRAEAPQLARELEKLRAEAPALAHEFAKLRAARPELQHALDDLRAARPELQRELDRLTATGAAGRSVERIVVPPRDVRRRDTIDRAAVKARSRSAPPGAQQ